MSRPQWTHLPYWFPWFRKKSKKRRRKSNFKPRWEILEDRSLPSAVPLNLTPDHFYSLDNTLQDDFGGPSLQADGGDLGMERYTFSDNQGLRLDGALASPDTYTIVMSLEIDAQGEFFRKLIDFQELAQDDGLYLSFGTLQMFPEDSGPTVISPDTDFQLIMSRDGQSGEVVLYIDGVFEITYTGLGSSAAFPVTNVLTFFEDDNVTFGFETVSGSVDYIAIYNQALTPLQIAGGGGNQAPTIDANLSSVTADEGQTATNAGVWNDPDGDSVTLVASAGTVVQNADGTWDWSFGTTDGPGESQSVVITATDSEGNDSTTSFDLVVDNVAPVITALTSDHSSLTSASADGTVTIVGGFSDAGTGDSHSVTVDWGDGTVETLPDEAVSGGQFSGSHTYSQGGVFTVLVTLTDSDGASAEQSTTAVVQGIGLVDGTLYVIGTDGEDNVDIDHVSGDGQQRESNLRVKLKSKDGGGNSQAVMTFDPADVNRIVVFTGDADDRVQIDRNIAINAIIMGGAGDDLLIAGGGNNVLAGGAGRDVLRGGENSDILIGGSGKDVLRDTAGNNLLIGDQATNENDLSALDAALASWLADDAAATEAALGSIIDDLERDNL